MNTKPIETNDYNVVLDYYAATGLLQTFISAFNGENVMRGRSILKDKMGCEIANSNLSIIDNPLLEKGMLTAKCDGEGSVSQKTDLVKDGVLNSFIYDIYTANKAGVETTSNGLRGSYLTTPMISPTNLEFKFSEMKDLENNIVQDLYMTIKSKMELNVEKKNALDLNQDELVHRGIKCNKCNMENIQGIRYKCLQCQDFNLCEKCEAQSDHDINHILIKIRKPLKEEEELLMQMNKELNYKNNKYNYSVNTKDLIFEIEKKKQAKLDEYSQLEYKLQKIEGTERSKSFSFDKNLKFKEKSYIQILTKSTE